MSSDMLIQEVDEELRRDRMRKLWRQTGPWIVVAAVAVVLGVAAYEGWTWWQKTQSASSSDQFYAATKIADGTDFAAAKKALDEVIAKGSGGYPMLAQFREAALLAQQGKIDDAVAAYDALSTSLNNTHLRELALVLAGNLLVDKGDVAAVEQRVGGLMTPASPMRNAAREEMGLAQYKAGKLDDAIKSFEAVVEDPLASRDEQSRVQIYMLQLEAEGAKPPAPPVDTTASTAPSAEVSSVAPPAGASSASAAPSASTAAFTSAAALTSASAEPSSASASAAPAAETSAAPGVPAATSAATDAGTDLTLTPPAIDASALEMAMPPASTASATTAPATSSAPAVSSETASSSAVELSSSLPASSVSSLAP